METRTEYDRLAGIASDSWYGKGVNATTVAYSVRVFSRHWRPGSCLELGPAEGLATASLVGHFADLTCVEGAEVLCAALRQRHPAIKVECSLFEEYSPAGPSTTSFSDMSSNTSKTPSRFCRA